MVLFVVFVFNYSMWKIKRESKIPIDEVTMKRLKFMFYRVCEVTIINQATRAGH